MFLYGTLAGTREGDSGKVSKIMLAIAFGKGVTMCEEYEATLKGKSLHILFGSTFHPVWRIARMQRQNVFIMIAIFPKIARLQWMPWPKLLGKIFNSTS